MDAIKLKRFYELGCLPRSLIKLCEIENHPITIDNFCNKFESFFMDMTENYGRLEAIHFPTVVIQLSLPTRCILSSDYSVFDQEFNQNGKRLILIFSDVNLEIGEHDIKHHCSVLTGINSTHFSLWTSCQDGTDGILPPFAKQNWIDKKCSGLILF